MFLLESHRAEIESNSDGTWSA